MNEEMKQWIDNSSFEELFKRHRFEPVGSPWYTGEIGRYFCAAFNKRKNEITDAEYMRISKSIGFPAKPH